MKAGDLGPGYNLPLINRDTWFSSCVCVLRLVMGGVCLLKIKISLSRKKGRKITSEIMKMCQLVTFCANSFPVTVEKINMIQCL